MEQERSIDRLARYVIIAATIAILAWLCWYFKNVLVYVIVAFVVSLIARPLMRLMRKVKIRGKSLPNGLLAIIAILVILGTLILVVTQVIPVVTGIVGDAAVLNSATAAGNPLDRVNDWIVGMFPGLGPDFNVIDTLMDKLEKVADLSNVTAVISSVTSVVTGLVVGLFSVVFISFFFVRDETLFREIVCALVPDRMEGQMTKSLADIEGLLSRYFVGLLVEMTGVALLDFLGLWIFARLGFSNALGIAFIAGILNIIPYVGPLLGELIGVILAVILKYGSGVGLPVNIWVFALIVLAIMLTTQLVDNFVYQPLIYSTSIKASPLEIFIVILLASHIGGVVGMLVAIPAYTVVRVIASRFFPDVKLVKRLIPNVGEVRNQE